MATDPRRGAQTVHRALDILECFSTEEPSLSLVELGRRLNLAGPTVHRLLKALEQKQMITQDPSTQRYSLGVGVMRLARVVQERSDLAALAGPSLTRLREATSETVGLHWLVNDQRVCIAELVSPHQVRMASGVGRTYPLYAGAAGKALLAWEHPAHVDRVIDEMPRRSRVSLLKELGRIRELGYAMSQQETVSDAAAVAAAILDASGRPVAAINITGPTFRWTAERMLENTVALRDEVALLSGQLGYERRTPSDGKRPME